MCIRDSLNFNAMTAEQVASFAPFKTADGKLTPTIHAAWAWPLTALLTWGCGVLLGKHRKT